MPAMEPLCYLLGINPSEFSKEENILLEAELFTYICEELKEFFKEQNKNYFRLMRLKKDKENTMLEAKFVRLIIQDILSTEEYNLNGIAYYTDSHEEVIQELILGYNTNPSAKLLRKIIALHQSVRSDLYQIINKKIISKLLTAAAS